jgi:hypothetical protein
MNRKIIIVVSIIAAFVMVLPSLADGSTHIKTQTNGTDSRITSSIAEISSTPFEHSNLGTNLKSLEMKLNQMFLTWLHQEMKLPIKQIRKLNESSARDYFAEFQNSVPSSQLVMNNITRIEMQDNYNNLEKTQSISNLTNQSQDPLVMVNEFPIKTTILFWTETIGTVYYTNLKFTNEANAYSYYGFISSHLSGIGLIDGTLLGLEFLIAAWGTDGAAAVILPVLGTALVAALGYDFYNAENNLYSAFSSTMNLNPPYFQLIYGYSFYFYNTISQFNIYGHMANGNMIPVFNAAPWPSSTAQTDFLNSWNNFANVYGQNNFVSYPEPNWVGLYDAVF